MQRDISFGEIPDENWIKISDLDERRRIQNRIAQRDYRKKLKNRLQDLVSFRRNIRLRYSYILIWY